MNLSYAQFKIYQLLTIIFIILALLHFWERIPGNVAIIVNCEGLLNQLTDRNTS